MTTLLHYELTSKIIGVYYDVYNGLGQAYPEYIYEQAMLHELQRRGISCMDQDEYEIFYREWLVGVQRLDIFVAGDVVVELKVQPRLTPIHAAQTMSYLKTVGKQVGLLFNFGQGEPEFRRLYFAESQVQPPTAAPQQTWPGLLFPELSYEIIGALFAVHNELGPGFIHRVYANACYQELRSRGLHVKPHQQMMVFYRGEPVGSVNLKHMLVEGCIMLFPVALRETTRIHAEPLRRWIASQDVSLGILANFHADRLEPLFMKEMG